MKTDRIEQKINDLKDSRDFYKCISKDDLELLKQLEEAINFIRSSTKLVCSNCNSSNLKPETSGWLSCLNCGHYPVKPIT